MSYDPRHLKEASRRLSAAQADHREKLAAFEAQCRRRLPELDALDGAIRRTVAQAVAAALQRGKDPAQAVDKARKENLELQEKRLELLKGAGIDPAQLEPTPLCPICGDTGRHAGAPCQCVARLCAEENEKELAQQLELSRFDFDSFQLTWYDSAFDPRLGKSPRQWMEVVLDTCRDFAHDFPDHPMQNLYLFGDTGLGKTFLSACVAKAVAKRGYWTVYATAGTLFGQYEALKFNRDVTGTAQEDVRRYEGCDLLVLDDLGSEMTTPFVQSALYQLLNRRILAGRHTVISSNLDMDAVRERYVAQVASRLEGEFQELPFVGRDIRLQRKEAR